MEIKVSKGPRCGFVIEVDCEVCEAVKRISKVSAINAIDVFEIALLEGLHLLAKKYLSKDT